MRRLVKNRSGFTLIELLVVIAIIGILAALIIVSLVGAQARARDTQRKSNAQSLNSALSQYFTDHDSSYLFMADDESIDSVNPCPLLSAYLTGSGACTHDGVDVIMETGDGAGGAGNTHYAQAWGLSSQGETPLTSVTGNGVYQLNGSSAVSLNGTDVADFNGIALGETNPIVNPAGTARAFVIYGPQ